MQAPPQRTALLREPAVKEAQQHDCPDAVMLCTLEVYQHVTAGQPDMSVQAPEGKANLGKAGAIILHLGVIDCQLLLQVFKHASIVIVLSR